jgi:hypothetical protein
MFASESVFLAEPPHLAVSLMSSGLFPYRSALRSVTAFFHDSDVQASLWQASA